MPPTDELKTTIISELGLADMPQPQQDELVQKVLSNIFDALMVTILEKMPDDAAREKFASMAEAGDLTVLKAYARTQIENVDELMTQTVQAEINAHK